MTRRRTTKLVRHGEYAAEVDVELIEDIEGWAPYLSPQDAYRLDDVQDATRLRGALSSWGEPEWSLRTNLTSKP